MSDTYKFLGYHDCYQDFINALADDGEISLEAQTRVFRVIDKNCAERFPEITAQNKKLSDEYKARLKRVEREKTND